MRLLKISLSAMLSALLLTACGQKGPLYFPEKPASFAPTSSINE